MDSGMKIQKAVTALTLTLFVATAPAALAKNEKQKGKKNGKHRTEQSQRYDDSRSARYDETFAQFDTNRDGVISRGEFPSDRGSFDRFDTNRDGVLTRAEIDQRLASRGNIETELRQLDRNRDGMISRSEWRGDNAAFER